MSFPYSLALRLRGICSMDNFFETWSSELQCCLVRRGYKIRFVKEQISRAQKMAHNEALKEKKDRPQDREITDRVTFPITDNRALPNIQDILRKKKKTILHSTERLIKKHLQRS